MIISQKLLFWAVSGAPGLRSDLGAKPGGRSDGMARVTVKRHTPAVCIPLFVQCLSVISHRVPWGLETPY